MRNITPALAASSFTGDAVQVALLMANAIDCEIITQLLAKNPHIHVVFATDDYESGFAAVCELTPLVLILDPKCGANSVSRTVETVIAGNVQRAILLDDRLREGLVSAILPFPQVSYLTRQGGSQPLMDAVLRVAASGERVFDLAIAARVTRTPRGWQIQQSDGQPSIATLTSRELEVLKLLANGSSVRDCAEQLQLSASTIDNHKTRLMKKLRIHKLTELTHVAIRDGLISF